MYNCINFNNCAINIIININERKILFKVYNIVSIFIHVYTQVRRKPLSEDLAWSYIQNIVAISSIKPTEFQYEVSDLSRSGLFFMSPSPAGS